MQIKSETHYEGTRYALVIKDSERYLLVDGDAAGFTGQTSDRALLCPLTAQNAAALRGRLPWLKPQPLGTKTSAGFGDRLGVATPGHIAAVQGTGVAPIFAQQSVRENVRTGRTPQGVLDDAMWGVFECDWREGWGADADHMKNLEHIQPFVDAGYTFFTIDPSDYVDDAADADDISRLEAKIQQLDWATLDSSPAAAIERYMQTFSLDDRELSFDQSVLFRAMAKYGNAVAHTVRMARHLQAQLGSDAFDLEMSGDETQTTTSLHEHFYIVSELRRLGVRCVSIAPRFVGRFEKGVDYIGDLGELEQNIAGHAAIMRYFGGYKLSLHTGSDKFGVYPIAMKHTGGLVHLKTAGTSYLEALRVLARCDIPFFREILQLAMSRYTEDRKTYHVSAELDKVPAGRALDDSHLPALLDQFDARQVLHVTFGSVLDIFGARLHEAMKVHEAAYREGLKMHFDRHLEALQRA
jgi:tagaturonate epimerase